MKSISTDERRSLAKKGAEVRLVEIEREGRRLRRFIGPTAPEVKATATDTPQRGKLSAAGRRNISLAQKRRWAKLKNGK